MSRSDPNLSPKVIALLEHERAIAPLPPAVRARALTRARAALVAGGMDSTAPTGTSRSMRWAAAAAAMCVVSAAVGAAAYGIRAHFANDSRASVSSAAPIATSRIQPAPEVTNDEPKRAPELTAPQSSSTSGNSVAPPLLSAADAARAELRLLKEARTAVARGDFAAALQPIAEHARRFRDGRLAEEREALRVKALSGLGRTSEARRAAAAFQARFPKSVLLPAVTQMPDSGP